MEENQNQNQNEAENVELSLITKKLDGTPTLGKEVVVGQDETQDENEPYFSMKLPMSDMWQSIHSESWPAATVVAWRV